MLIGVPKEIKNQEYRVGLTPQSVEELVSRGHKICVESNAGVGIGADDDVYRNAGAEIMDDPAKIFAAADMIVKVKEPQAVERKRLRKGQILFTYLHLAPDLEQTRDLVDSGVSAVAYETVTDSRGRLPLLTPMSQVAGRLSIQAGAHALEKARGGAGILLGGVPGVAPAKVTIIGGGVVGSNAAEMALGLGADVTIFDRDTEILAALSARFGHALRCLYANRGSVDQHVTASDLVVGAVLVVGASAPKLVSAAQISKMRPGSAVVDVAIDQGGCFETSRPTTHDDPIYQVDDVIHYCVANMPGAVPRTSTYALNNVTFPYILRLAEKGLNEALLGDQNFLNGLNVHEGKITYAPVADAHQLDYADPRSALQ